jgi:hypothetical protein
MKRFVHILRSTGIATAAAFIGFVGCEYDVTEPLWEQPFDERPVPVITGVQPAPAGPGVNTITITGQHFGSVPDVNGVYFNTVATEIVSRTATELVVRRPVLIADDSEITVVPDSTLVVATHSYGRIDPVMERFGAFRDGLTLNALAVNEDDNLFVASTNRLWHVDENGGTSIVEFSGGSIRTPNDAKIRDGILYLFAANNRYIQTVNVDSNIVSDWIQLPPGRAPRVGDFDENGYLYAGGGAGASGTDLIIIPPDPPQQQLSINDITLEGSYASDEIQSIRVFNGYVYVASRPLGIGTSTRIWRHAITGPGQLGSRESVLDMSAFQDFSLMQVRTISLAETGTIFLTVDEADAMLIYESETNTLDYFYRHIIPPFGKHAFWGTGNFLYMITNDPANPDIALRWNIARIDIGINGAPYY